MKVALQKLERLVLIENPEYDFTCPKCGSNHIYQYESQMEFLGKLAIIRIAVKTKQ